MTHRSPACDSWPCSWPCVAVYVPKNPCRAQTIQDYFTQIEVILRKKLPAERFSCYPDKLSVADVSLYEELKPDQMGQRIWDRAISDQVGCKCKLLAFVSVGHWFDVLQKFCIAASQDLWSGDVLVVQLKPLSGKGADIQYSTAPAYFKDYLPNR